MAFPPIQFRAPQKPTTSPPSGTKIDTLCPPWPAIGREHPPVGMEAEAVNVESRTAPLIPSQPLALSASGTDGARHPAPRASPWISPSREPAAQKTK
jgi:hypothetical protein